MKNVREKIFLLLLGGLALGCAYTPGKQRMVFKSISAAWKNFDKRELREGIAYLYRLGLIDKKYKGNTAKILITKKGKLWAMEQQLNNIKYKKEKWDGKWRIISFDIPNKYKSGRDALRQKLKNIGFKKLQESVFITPYNCRKEMEMLVNFFELQKYVRIGILEFIDNQEYLKKIFGL